MKRILYCTLIVLLLTGLLAQNSAMAATMTVSGVTVSSYTSDVTPGVIRYVSQRLSTASSYGWGKYSNNTTATYGPENNCTMACQSMAFSYLGINATPEQVVKNTPTVFSNPYQFTEAKVSYKTGTAATTSVIDSYLNLFKNDGGLGNYSPIVIHYTNGQSGSSLKQHAVLIIGKDSNGYIALDPWLGNGQNYTQSVRHLKMTAAGNQITGDVPHAGIGCWMDAVQQYVLKEPRIAYSFDVNAIIDGVLTKDANDAASFDVYLAGVKQSYNGQDSGLSDFYSKNNVEPNTAYEITNVKSQQGYKYVGVASSSSFGLSGTVSQSFTEVILEYVTCTHVTMHENIVVQPSCTEPGTKERICADCGYKESQTVAATGHTVVNDAAIAAGCETTGKTAGTHCSVCGQIISAQTTIPAKGHTPVTDPAIAATCTAAGKTEGSHCSVCGTVITAQQVIPAKGHTPVTDAAVEATCTEGGLTEGSHCSVCGEILVAQSATPPKGHTIVTDPAIAATCTAAGKTEGSHCSVCGTVITAQQVIPAKGHTPVTDAAVEATCTAGGLTEGSHCSDCGVILVAQSATPPKGHTIVTDPAVAATCTAAGKTEGSHCSVCGTVITAQQVIPAKGHTPVTDAAVEATCTEGGLTEGSHCSDCREILVAQSTTPPKGHTIVTDATVAATCTTGGKTEGSHCSVCGTVLTAQTEIPPTGHTPGEWMVVTEPTTTSVGLKEQRCIVCGIVVATEEMPIIDPNPDPDPIPEPAVQTISAKKGETITLGVYINARNASMVTLKTSWDSSIFEFVSSECTEGQSTNGVFSLYSLSSTLNGKIGTITFKLKDDVADGTYKVTVSVTEAYDIDENTVACKAAADNVKVVSRVPGDVTGDGVVDGRDLLRLAKYLGGYDVSINSANATVNGDNAVDGRDLLRLAKYLGGYDVILQ